MKLRIVRASVWLGLLVPVSMLSQISGSPVVKDFVSGGKIKIALESGGYDIRPSTDHHIRIRWNEASGKGVKVTATADGKFAELRVENTPHNFHATIEVPAEADLSIRMTAGALTVSGIRGDKDIESNAGDVTVDVGKSDDWSQVDASITAGDLAAPAFATSKGGLFRSLHWRGPGRYRLRVTLWAGNIFLRRS